MRTSRLLSSELDSFTSYSRIAALFRISWDTEYGALTASGAQVDFTWSAGHLISQQGNK